MMVVSLMLLLLSTSHKVLEELELCINSSDHEQESEEQFANREHLVVRMRREYLPRYKF